MSSHRYNVSNLLVIAIQESTQHTRGIHLMMFDLWASVQDDEPTSKQHRVNAPCLPGSTLTLSPLSPTAVVIISGNPFY